MGKKTQQSLEFLLVFLFLIFVVGAAMGITGKIFLGVRDEGFFREQEYFGDFVLNEVEILNQVQYGYYKEVMLPTRFKVELTKSPTTPYYLLTIIDKENDNREKYYKIHTEYNVSIKEENDRYFVVLEKEYEADSIHFINA